MKTTLKKLVERINEQGEKDNIDTIISVFITSNKYDDGRKTISIDPNSKDFADRIAMIGFEDCTVSDLSLHVLSEKEYLYIIIVDLDMQYKHI